jgi:hypothetical protein
VWDEQVTLAELFELTGHGGMPDDVIVHSA